MSLPGVEERHALAERHRRQPELLHPDPVLHRGALRQLEGVGVEQRLVVVLGDVDDVLLRVRGVAGGAAVVVDVAPVTVAVRSTKV
jgi:hypothetical protein